MPDFDTTAENPRRLSDGETAPGQEQLAQRSLENPVFPIDPQQLDSIWGYGPTRSGVQINEHTALTFTAVFAAVKILAESIGCLPLVVYNGTEDDEERKPAPENPVYRLLRYEPNPEMSASVWKETLEGHVAIWGDCYARIKFNNGGDAVELIPLRPDRTHAERYGGKLFYGYEQGGRFAPEEILHIPSFGFDGISGYGPVKMSREMIASGKAAEILAATNFGNGALLKGILESAKILTPAQMQDLRESWAAMYAGVGNSNKTAVLPNGTTFKPISQDFDKTQLLQTREFIVNEVARIYRIPPHMLAVGKSSGRANLEQASLEFLIYCLLPWMEKWEQEVNRKLFTKHDYHAKFNERRLLRADSAARMQAFALARQWGSASANDGRRDEGFNPIGKQGDIYLSPANMHNAQDVADGKVQPQPPGGGGAGHEKPGGIPVTAPGVSTPPARAALAMQGVFEDAVGRMLRKEANAMSRGNADDAFYQQHREHVREAVYPAARSLLAVLGKPLDRASGKLIETALIAIADERQEQTGGNLEEMAVERAGRIINRIIEGAIAA